MYLCRYSVAITKVIGRDLDSIVVDTEKTGKDCIQFMKDQVWYSKYMLKCVCTLTIPHLHAYTHHTSTRTYACTHKPVLNVVLGNITIFN